MANAPRRVRDAAFTALVAKYNLANSPALNAEIAALGVPKVESIVEFKKQDHRIIFTVEQAVEYVELPVFQGERNVEDEWAQHILEEMVSCRFNWDLVILARCLYDGEIYKINGQHTAWGRLACRMAHNPSVREIIYQVKTEEELRRIYGTFDTGKRRTPHHLMQVELLGQGFDSEIRRRTATRMATALKFLIFENREAYRKVREDQLVALAAGDEHRENFETVSLFCQRFVGDAWELIERQPVMAAMLVTFPVDEEAAVDFWTDVIDGTNLTKEDTRWHLRNDLATTTLGAKQRSGNKKVVTAEDMYRVCVGLWNKWRRSEVPGSVRVPASRPKPI